MFHNTPMGLQLDTKNGWTVSISLGTYTAKEYCEIAVWPTGKDTQDNWVRWGANMAEPPDFPIYDRVLGNLTADELVNVLVSLSDMPKDEVVSNKWLPKGFSKDAIWKK